MSSADRLGCGRVSPCRSCPSRGPHGQYPARRPGRLRQGAHAAARPYPAAREGGMQPGKDARGPRAAPIMTAASSPSETCEAAASMIPCRSPQHRLGAIRVRASRLRPHDRPRAKAAAPLFHGPGRAVLLKIRARRGVPTTQRRTPCGRSRARLFWAGAGSASRVIATARARSRADLGARIMSRTFAGTGPAGARPLRRARQSYNLESSARRDGRTGRMHAVRRRH